MNKTPQSPKNLRVEMHPYPHLRDDDGCVLATDYIFDEKIDFILQATGAAPDMLAALKDAADYIERVRGDDFELVVKARAAIAKAEGRS
jgi:hypothetical protein